jgi:prophage maintenance system killer protein
MAHYDGQLLHEDLFRMAAALHFSLVLKHPFVDGNKRTALMAALTFLGVNGHFPFLAAFANDRYSSFPLEDVEGVPT